MACTVVPLYNLDLPRGTQIPFGNGFVLQDMPEWVKKDQGVLNDMHYQDRQATLSARHALVAEYEAASIGHPDPHWPGKTPKSIQELKFQSAMLANLALWLSQPSTVCFTVCFHALSVIQRVDRHDTLYCHPNDSNNPVLVHHVQKAGEFHITLSAVPRRNPVWAALRAFWIALTMYQSDYRYPLFWQGLESLFGSDNETRGVTRRLCDRISFFLADDFAIQQDVFKKVKSCYGTRSEIVHGRWEEGPEIDIAMGTTEGIVRSVMRRIIQNPEMLAAFISPKRDDFLEQWTVSKSFTPPPFPK